MTTANPTNLQRLRTCEMKIAQMQKMLDLVLPLAQWALAEIMAEQESRIETDKRLGIR
jgi:hypothetical protein